MSEYDEYIGNPVPEEAEEQDLPEDWGDFKMYTIGTLSFLTNFADVVTYVWDENDPEPNIDEIGIAPL